MVYFSILKQAPICIYFIEVKLTSEVSTVQQKISMAKPLTDAKFNFFIKVICTDLKYGMIITTIITITCINNAVSHS